ncbi:MAG: hypothetical protein AABX07_00240 [Nanoarchaeota archaeon]
MSARHLILARAMPKEKPYISPVIKTIIIGTPGTTAGNCIYCDNQRKFYRDSSDFDALQERLSELPLYAVGPRGQLQFLPERRKTR